jgi:flagellar hook-associated protein 2
MSSVTFSGLATGLDTDSIVDSLMAIERAPIDSLQAQRDSETERLNAYAQFKGYLEELKSAAADISLTSQVKNNAVSLSSDSYFGATVSSEAAEGDYKVAVGQLAQVQKTVSDGWSSASDALLGTGTITINGTDIDITAENNSLNGLVSTINELSDSLGVTASIINDGTASPYRLLLTGNDSSTSFTVSSNLTDGVDPIAFNTTDTATAQQAEIYVDGVKIVSDSNTIDDAIAGITFTVDSVSPTDELGDYETVLMSVDPDTSSVKENITAFVSSYNRAMDWILSGYQEFSNTPEASTTEGEDSPELLGSVLRGDTTINSIKRGLQNIITSVFDGPETLTTLGQIGITTELNGKLNLNSETMEEAVDTNLDDITALLSGTDDTDGVMKEVNSYLGDLLFGSGSFYAMKKDTYTAKTHRIDDQIASYEARMDKREMTLRARFSAMESLVSSLNSTSEFLTQQLSNISSNKK